MKARESRQSHPSPPTPDHEKQSLSVPGNYVEVQLSSLGKLSLPSVIHVRNYSLREAALLSEMTAHNQDEVIANVLNGMVWEDVDMALAHQQEAAEILLNVWGSWWGSKIEGPRYYVDLETEGKERDAKENISIATIPLNAIQTTPLAEEVVEPFGITIDGEEVQFITPRLQTTPVAQRYTKQQHTQEDHEFHETKKKLQRQETLDEEEREAYADYQRRRSTTYLTARRAQLIVSHNKQTVEEFDEAYEIAQSLDLRFWNAYGDVVKRYFTFGVNPEVTFECSVKHEPITRRFSFRFVDFIPPLGKENSGQYALSFG